jgi:hypothetical protein
MLGKIVLDVVAPLKKRIEELEARELSIDERVITDLIGDRLVPINQTLDALPAVLEKKIPKPKDGNDATDAQVRAAVAEYFEDHPVREAKDGQDGDSVSLDDIRPLIEAELAKALLEFERSGNAVIRSAIDKIGTPKDGAPGKDADPQEVARRVIDSLDLKGRDQDVRVICRELVKEAVAQMPLPKDGKDGAPGKDGLDGADGENGIDGKDGASGKNGIDGKDGSDGEDGKSVTIEDIEARLMAIHATWALDWEKRAQDAISRLPKPKDGRDAISLEGCKVELADDERTLVITLAAEGKSFEHRLKLSHMIYREVWSKDADYEKGDCVTYGGSIWVCIGPNKSSRPGGSNVHWRLAVKRGRDS